MQNCCINVLMTFPGVIIYCETFTRRQRWGIPISITAILLLSL